MHWSSYNGYTIVQCLTRSEMRKNHFFVLDVGISTPNIFSINNWQSIFSVRLESNFKYYSFKLTSVEKIKRLNECLSVNKTDRSWSIYLQRLLIVLFSDSLTSLVLAQLYVCPKSVYVLHALKYLLNLKKIVIMYIISFVFLKSDWKY